MNFFKFTTYTFSVLAVVLASSTALAMSKPQLPNFLKRPPEPAQPPTQIFWHENSLNGQSFCSSTFRNMLIESGDFMLNGNRHPSDILQPIVNNLGFRFRSVTPDIMAYDLSGNCRLIDGRRTGSLSFGAQPGDDGIGAGLYVFQGFEDKAILSTSYFAISSDPSRGPWIRSRINYTYNNVLPEHIFSGSEKYFDIEMRYLSNEGIWKTATRNRIVNGTGKEIIIQHQLPYDTLAELRIVAPSDVFLVPAAHELHNLFGDYIFPTVYNLSFQTETCVPDLISDECIE